MLDLAGQTPQLGVVLSVSQRDIRVRKQNGGEVSLALGQCIPITPSGNMLGTRQGESFTHFISMEFQQDEIFKAFQKKVIELQERMGEMDGIGKAAKPESLHLTMATLHAGADEVGGLMEKTELIFKKYIDIIDSPCGLSTTFKGIDYGDYDAVWIEISLGEESVQVLREVIEDEVGHLLTDFHFHAQITIFRGNDLSDERKETIKAAVREVRLGSATIGEVTLRSKKTGKVMTEPLLTMKLADKTV
jgi:2'-5' RNA ligase